MKFVVGATATLLAMLCVWMPVQATAAPPDHGWERHCGSQNAPGYGWYNVRAYNTRCNVARQRVAQHYKEHPRDYHFNGWDCDRDQTGYETSRVDCIRMHSGQHQHVRFEFGA